MTYQDFAERLIASMKLRGFIATRSPHGICMKSLAQFADASEQICRRYIRGDALPNYEKVVSIAKHLNVSPGWLLFGDAKNLGNRKVLEEEVLSYILQSTHALFWENSVDFAEFVLGLLKEIRDIDVPNDHLYKIIDLAVGSVANFQKKSVKLVNN